MSTKWSRNRTPYKMIFEHPRWILRLRSVIVPNIMENQEMSAVLFCLNPFHKNVNLLTFFASQRVPPTSRLRSVPNMAKLCRATVLGFKASLDGSGPPEQGLAARRINKNMWSGKIFGRMDVILDVWWFCLKTMTDLHLNIHIAFPLAFRLELKAEKLKSKSPNKKRAPKQVDHSNRKISIKSPWQGWPFSKICHFVGSS